MTDRNWDVNQTWGARVSSRVPYVDLMIYIKMETVLNLELHCAVIGAEGGPCEWTVNTSRFLQQKLMYIWIVLYVVFVSALQSKDATL